uniref:leucine-rich repeat flightless-interacting protein 2-like n=1 Tax=Myxine glutinosa TaxID=7769 RepID=UPI00358DFEA1
MEATLQKKAHDSTPGVCKKCSLRDLEDKYKKEMMISTQRNKDNIGLSYQMEILREVQEDLEEEVSRTKKDLKEASKENKKLQDKEKALSREVSALREIIKKKEIKASLNLLPRQQSSRPQRAVLTRHQRWWKTARYLARTHKVRPPFISHAKGSFQSECRRPWVSKRQERRGTKEDARGEEGQNAGVKGKKQECKSPGWEHIVPAFSALLGIPLNITRSQFDARMHFYSVTGLLSMRLSDYKSKIRNLEEEKTSLEQAVFRVQEQVVRYRAVAEQAGACEQDLKVENQKLQRQLRITLNQLQHLDIANDHLLNRLEKLKARERAFLSER